MNEQILNIARNVLEVEAKSIIDLKNRLNENFSKVVELIRKAQGKVITTGIGKSGLIAGKIAGTFNSIGITSVFLHPVEALHGDLGMVQTSDIVIALSHSGSTRELVELVPILKQRGAIVVAMTGGLHSPLAAEADYLIDCGVEREACSLGLIPTASTTAVLAMGDALAVALVELRDFKPADFRRSHPGGQLGERLSLTVEQVMLTGNKLPWVMPEALLREALEVMDKKDLGTVLVTDPSQKLLGIFTDGDLRRLTLRTTNLSNLLIKDVMIKNPLTSAPGDLVADALHIMEKKLITSLPVADEAGFVLGIVHFHDLLGRGDISFR